MHSLDYFRGCIGFLLIINSMHNTATYRQWARLRSDTPPAKKLSLLTTLCCSSGDRAKMFLKDHLGKTISSRVDVCHWGCIVRDLMTIIALVLLAFNFIPQSSHHSLTLRSRFRDSKTYSLNWERSTLPTSILTFFVLEAKEYFLRPKFCLLKLKL